MEPQIVLKIDNNHTLKASNFKIFLGACPQTPLEACDYRTSVLMRNPNNFYPHTPMSYNNYKVLCQRKCNNYWKGYPEILLHHPIRPWHIMLAIIAIPKELCWKNISDLPENAVAFSI